MVKKVINAARSKAFGLFKNPEADWFFRRILEPMAVGGAEIGECLSVARNIKETDWTSWVNEWQNLAHRLMDDANQAYQNGNKVSAREAYLRAANYFGAAEYCAGPDHKNFNLLWE